MTASGDSQPNSGARSQRERVPTAAEARAEFEAVRGANRAAREAALSAAFPDGVPGRWVPTMSWLTTLVFFAVTVPAVVDPDRFVAAYFFVAMALFLAGCILFALVLVLAAGRSRDDLMGIGGLFLLMGSAPRRVQMNLLGSMAVQIVVAAIGVGIHPFTPLAFGTLVPTIGLSFCGLWSTLHGHFPPQNPTVHP